MVLGRWLVRSKTKGKGPAGVRGCRPKGQPVRVVCRPYLAFGFCFAAGLGLTGFGLWSGSRVRARLGLRAAHRVRAGVG